MEAEFVQQYGHRQDEGDDEVASICDGCFEELNKRRAARSPR
jgi:hypothetical protein